VCYYVQYEVLVTWLLHLTFTYLLCPVPLFLFDSDLQRVIRETGSLLIAFFVGALSTIIGTIGAFALIPLKSLGEEGWKVASALCSRHIGGAINFVAVADTLQIEGSIIRKVRVSIVLLYESVCLV